MAFSWCNFVLEAFSKGYFHNRKIINSKSGFKNFF